MNGYEVIDEDGGLNECPVCFAVVGAWSVDSHARYHALRLEFPPVPDDVDSAWGVDRRTEWLQYYAPERLI